MTAVFLCQGKSFYNEDMGNAAKVGAPEGVTGPVAQGNCSSGRLVFKSVLKAGGLKYDLMPQRHPSIDI